MTMHAIRGPAAEHQLSVCMIAMRTLSKMYWAAGWIRNIFQKLGEKKQKNFHGVYTSGVPTRVPSPVPESNDQSQPQATESVEAVEHMQPNLEPPVPHSEPAHAEASRLDCHEAAQIPNIPQPDSSLTGIHYIPFASTVHDPTALHAFGHDQDARNMVGYMDYPMIDHSGLASIDPDFADWWQDLLTTDIPFSNPFITGGVAR